MHYEFEILFVYYVFTPITLKSPPPRFSMITVVTV